MLSPNTNACDDDATSKQEIVASGEQLTCEKKLSFKTTINFWTLLTIGKKSYY